MATPKLPSPPRIAQKRSGSLSSLAWTTSPSAVTTSAASRSSIVTPFLRTRKPTPPASVMPPMPTEPVSPRPVTSPCSPVATVYSPAVIPASTEAVLAVGVDLEALHPREVDDETTVGGPVTRAAMAAAADGELEAGVAGERDDTGDVLGAGDLGDRHRPAVVSLEEDLAGVVVRLIVRRNQGPFEIGAETVDGQILGLWLLGHPCTPLRRLTCIRLTRSTSGM